MLIILYIIVFSDDFDNIDDKAIQLANQVVATVLPGSYTSAVVAAS